MALDRQEYPAMLATLQHAEAVQVLDHRIRTVSQINTGIADWLQERRRLEEQYAQGLRKLARRPAFVDPQELGVFATPWSALISALDTLADTHHSLGQKIEQDVEQPLRLFNTHSREMTGMGNIQGNLHSLSKDIDTAQKKLDKLSQKGAVQKAATTSRELDNAQTQWEAQAPFVFESLQALDENRLNHLRDVLTQFQTHEVDKVERNRIAAEQCLNVLLSVETADEIKTFALRTSSDQRPSTSRRPQAIQQSSSASALTQTPTGARGSDDAVTPRSDSVPDLPTPRAEKPRGLRRLGTVLGRRREHKPPYGTGRMSDSPERNPDKRASRLPNSSTFASFSNRMGRSREAVPVLEAPREEEAERPRSPLRTVSDRSERGPSSDIPTANGAAETIIPNGSHQNDLAGLSLDEPASRQQSNAAANENPDKFAEASSTKPPALDPISQAEHDAAEASGEVAAPAFKVAIKDTPATHEEGDADALASISNTLRMQGPPAAGRRVGTARGRRDNRASVYDPSPALTLPGQIAVPPPISEASRGIIEEPATTATASVPISSPQPSAPLALPTATPFAPFQSGISHSPLPAFRPASASKDDAGSVRSGRSHSTTASASHRHPELNGPGLNVSFIETVSAWFESGKLNRSVVIGEAAVTHNGPDSPSDDEVIRLTNFDHLDKVAPNPAFLSDHSEGAGTYTLNTLQLGKGKQTAFKYQLSAAASVSEGRLAPIVVTPAWKIEPTQASIIVSYGINPDFTGLSSGVVTLKDVTLVLHMGEGTKTSSCLSKPVGTFSKERGVIFWTLGEVTLKKGEQKKVLARVQTEGEAKAGKVEARWIVEDVGSDVGLEVKGEEDPFSDGEGTAWKALSEGSVRRRIVGGTYQGT